MEFFCGDIASLTFIDKVYEFDSQVITVKKVPVLKCLECGELYIDPMVSIRVEQLGELKHKLEIENFTGETPIAAEQDFYASMYLSLILSSKIINNTEKFAPTF